MVTATKRQGRLRKLSQKAVRGVQRKAKEGRLTARMVMEELDAAVSLRTVQPTLANDENMVFRALKTRPPPITCA